MRFGIDIRFQEASMKPLSNQITVATNRLPPWSKAWSIEKVGAGLKKPNRRRHKKRSDPKSL